MRHFATFVISFLFSLSLTSAKLSVGIVGAGASGLYAAILLQSLGIEVEILEASDRPGGRIWTHYFDPERWKASKAGEPEYYDYFDAGAMRIPQTPFMDRLVGNQSYSLVSYLNSHVKGPDKLTLIPYIFSNNETFLYYNHNLRKSSDSLAGDPFKTGLAKFSASDPHSIWDSVIQDFITSLSANFAQGFAQLTQQSQSVRQYLGARNLSFLEINWLETFLDGTGHFDVDLAETVLEDWLFGVDDNYTWTTIEGGMSRLITSMTSLLKRPIRYSQRVTAISQADHPKKSSDDIITVTTSSGTQRTYNHVINTVPLGAMQAMDMSTLGLGYAKDSAIRMINYDASMKIGIKFKSRWWQSLQPNPIFGGQSKSDLPIRTCVYPSYGIDTPNAAAVMIASYTWGQDALRLSSYLPSPPSSSSSSSSFAGGGAGTVTDNNNNLLLNQTLTSLATLNNISTTFLREQYLDHVAHSWYSSSLSPGAFPIFAPGQFAELMPLLMSPAAAIIDADDGGDGGGEDDAGGEKKKNRKKKKRGRGRGGRVHFGGDALSAGHAWIVGALNAGYRCVREVLEAEGDEAAVGELERMWGLLTDIHPTDPNSSYNTILKNAVRASSSSSSSSSTTKRTRRRGERRAR